MSNLSKVKFRIYEIEHNGDIDDVINELSSYGAVKVEVLSTDYNTESAVFEATVPDDKLKSFIVDVRTKACV
jgi:hypothetical protein